MTGVGLQGAHVHDRFHGIGTPQRTLEPGEDRYWVAIDEFLAMLDAIAAAPGVRISFDDGNASDIEIALGGLRERDPSRRRSSSSPVDSDHAGASTPTVCASSSRTG